MYPLAICNQSKSPLQLNTSEVQAKTLTYFSDCLFSLSIISKSLLVTFSPDNLSYDWMPLNP